jgi:hypothetical protein
MNFRQMCNDSVTIERVDGTRHENIMALVSAKSVLIPDETVPIDVGDVILRKLPSGIVERMTVIDPGFHAKFHGIKAHYQVKYRREGTQASGQAGYVVHVSGVNSRVNIGSVDASNNLVIDNALDAGKLADDLATLRDALLPVATIPEHYVAIGQLSSAQIAAKSGDTSKAMTALSALGTAGKWAWDMANKIGAGVAAGAIKSHLGL